MERNPLPREIFRDDVEPKRGGKVPEAAKTSQRIELNKIDAVGLDRSAQDTGNSIGGDDFFQSSFYEEDYSSEFPYNPVFDPIKISGSSETGQQQQTKYTNPYAAMYDSLFKKPQKKPVKKSSKDTYKYVDIEQPPPPPPKASYDPYYSPAPAYEPVQPYAPPPESYDSYYEPPNDPYYEPPPPSYEAPEPYKPKGPVLLEKRPYEVKSVQPLPITVAESYTSFDCRSLYPGRHYADPETGCQVRHSVICNVVQS